MSLWNLRFMDLAREVSTWSNIPNPKVGCVLVDDRRRVVGLGYNTLPEGVQESIARLSDLSIRHHMVQHAEVNAMVQCVGDPRGGTAYVTHKPCASCTGVLIQAGIRKIVTNAPDPDLMERFADSFAAADVMLAEAGIDIEVLA